MKMKLYVWEGVLTDFTDGMLVAVAGSVADARAAARASLLRDAPWPKLSEKEERDLAKRPRVFGINKARAFFVRGGG